MNIKTEIISITGGGDEGTDIVAQHEGVEYSFNIQLPIVNDSQITDNNGGDLLFYDLDSEDVRERVLHDIMSIIEGLYSDEEIARLGSKDHCNNWEIEASFEKIIKKIKEANEASNTVIADDESNEVILSILTEFDIDDSEESLTSRFGQHRFTIIRDAENGLY